jgi:uncharacterized protein (DUF1697 family)
MRWVAFLRAINVGGRRATGDQLVAAFAALGFADISTFLASGNVIFSADKPSASVIEAALESELGYPVPVILRTQLEVERIASEQPFTDAELDATDGRVQVMLLRDPVVQPEQVGLNGIPDSDLVRFGTSELFWLPKQGISTSELDPKKLETQTGPLTVRTLNTVVRLASRL